MEPDADALERQARLLRTLGIENRDDLPWDEAPLPPREHECIGWSVTRDAFGVVKLQRCACGGLWSLGLEGWIDINSRREDEPTEVTPRRRWWQVRAGRRET